MSCRHEIEHISAIVEVVVVQVRVLGSLQVRSDVGFDDLAVRLQAESLGIVAWTEKSDIAAAFLARGC